MFEGNPGKMETARTWAACTKNPGHQSFVPYPDFRVEHLPEDLQTESNYYTVRNLAARTVRLRVGYTSTDRPDGYPFHNVRGTNIIHTGSGWLDTFFLPKHPPGTRSVTALCHLNFPCPCPGCSNRRHNGLTSEHEEWYEVHIVTARHVVYDKAEAQATLVDFFYDDENSEVNGEMKTIWSFDVVHHNSDRDTCVLRCVTYDKAFIDRLEELSEYFEHASTCNLFSCGETYDSACVIVSHPHGQPKQVTLGEFKKKFWGSNFDQFTYTTDTCPGSSGAPVLWVPRGISNPTYLCDGVHSMGSVMGPINQGFSLWNV